MVGLYASVVGVVVLGLLVIIGLWLTWFSLRDEHHTPAALQADAADEPE